MRGVLWGQGNFLLTPNLQTSADSDFAAVVDYHLGHSPTQTRCKAQPCTAIFLNI